MADVQLRYRVLLDSLTEAVLVFGPDGRIREANTAAVSMLALPVERLLRATVDQLGLTDVDRGTSTPDGARDASYAGSPAEVPNGVATVAAAVRAGEACSDIPLAVARPDGSRRWLLCSTRPLPASVEDGHPAEVLLSLHDVTEQRRSQLEVTASEHRLRVALETLPHFFAVYAPARDDDGRLVDLLFEYVNAAGLEVLGRPLEEVIGHGMIELLPAHIEMGLFDRYVKVVETGETDRFDIPWFEDSGVEGAFAVTAARMDGRLVILARDVTERLRDQRELAERAEALERSNRDLQDFAYAVSHDLAAPLRSVRGFVEVLDRRLGTVTDPDVAEALQFIRSGTDRSMQMLTGLLAYSRVHTEAAPAEAVSLAEVLDDVRANLRGQLDESHATVEQVGELPTVWGDRTQLLQLLQNLVANSVTYVARGVAPVVQVAAARVGDAWQVCVTDNGVGVDPGRREDAFRLFTRVGDVEAHPGTGVGLALCRRVVTRHGGRIWLEAAAGGGTRAVFTLPDRPVVSGSGP